MVLCLLWMVVLTAPLIALTLTARPAPSRRTDSGKGRAETADDATVATVPTVVSGAFWRRGHPRRFQFH